MKISEKYWFWIKLNTN